MYRSENLCSNHDKYCDEAQKEIKRRLAIRIIHEMDFEDLEKVFEIYDHPAERRIVVELKVPGS